MGQLGDESHVFSETDIMKSFRSKSFPHVHRRSDNTDLLQRSEMLLAIQDVVSSSPQCAALPTAVLSVPHDLDTRVPSLTVDAILERLHSSGPRRICQVDTI